MKNVAVYWDFENIHASLCARQFGQSWYRNNTYAKQPHLVDINSIMQYVAELGNVNINRAYANWSFLHTYSFDLQNFSVDLIQLFPRGRYGKNGADIRMSIEILEDLAINRHIDIVVLIGGDSDYIAVAQKVRQRGKTIIGIGAQETTNQFWVKACNEFKYYSSLLVKSASIKNLEAEGYEVEDITSAKALLRVAIEAATSSSGQEYIVKAALKPLIQRFDPSFDELNYGFKSFSELLAACGDIVEVQHGEHDHIIRLKNGNHASNHEALTTPVTNRYEAILKRQQIRLIAPHVLELALREVFELLYNRQIEIINFRKLLFERMQGGKVPFSETDATKVRGILYKAMAFRYLDKSQTTLAAEIDSADQLVHRVRYTLLKRILDNISEDEPDAKLLAEIIFGNREQVNEVHQLVNEYNRTEQESQ